MLPVNDVVSERLEIDVGPIPNALVSRLRRQAQLAGGDGTRPHQ